MFHIFWNIYSRDEIENYRIDDIEKLFFRLILYFLQNKDTKKIVHILDIIKIFQLYILKISNVSKMTFTIF